ncbi:efflux RND transporter periplasmic adaptor subunit [Parapedobacter sp. ISTM3]|uniref:HlyD family secretion protein n=1 Tax=Parapedobacter luteus TaxID=623280 RepID=A0A1T5C9A3_9SPHI|nr:MULTISPECIES: efflux RND transporter periplasmic adaptor subunit [Parapedobacter]MBK1439150.1 efflux RND transporter periplasmic adaptor subunit [Parapedobacter sp. ISTM3]SKB55690.1 HlyD family secretion protein [Parapedobacter luteus]
MAKKKNTLKYVVIGAVILLVLVIIANKMGWIGQGDVIKVATEKAEKRTVNEQVSASGKIHPEVEVKLSSEVSGEIVELNVKEGDVVTKGQVLCRIRPDILQSGYDRAVASLNAQRASLAVSEQQLKQQEANFVNIEATFNRNKELFERKVVSAAEFDKARADYESALASLEAQRQSVLAARYGIDQSQASVNEAGDNLARTTIYAPVDGVVSLLQAELGERVVGTAQMAGTEIMRIANMSSMEVVVEVNENDITRVALNNEATIEVDAFQGREFRGVVTEIASSSTTAATTTTTTAGTDQVTNFNVKVRILSESYEDLLKKDQPNPSPFRPGLSATVDIHTKQDTGLAVPIQAVTTREASGRDTTAANTPTADSPHTAATGAPKMKEYVFVYNNGTVKQVEVTTGIQDDMYIRILSGLNEGDEVVSRPFNAISKILRDGSKVEKVDRNSLL